MIWKRTGKRHVNAVSPFRYFDVPNSSPGHSSQLTQFSFRLHTKVILTVCHHNAKDIQCELNGYELPSRSMFGCLCSIDWHDGVQDASANAIDKARAYHPFSILRRALESCTQDGPDGSKRYSPDAALLITEPPTKQRTHESAEVVDGDNSSLQKGVVDDG